MANKFINSQLFSLLLLILCVSLLSCSKAKSPVEPAIGNPDSPIPIAESNSTRTVLAVYDATIDPVAKTFTVTPPKDRLADYHFPLTQFYPNVLKITGYGWTPNFWADIKLTHPFPGSGIDAFDPRVIAILPANPGVSFNYPIFNCVGNNSVVLEPDGYTKLFDSLGGGIPGNTNPFKAYFKDQPNRIWSSIGVTSQTQRWNMSLAGFGGPMIYKLVVDVSTNYPNPPQPVIDNAPEPVQNDAKVYPGLTSGGGDSLIKVTFLDWQGASDIKCKVESPQLFNGVIQLLYSGPGANPNEYVFSGTISNSLLAPVGDYNVLIAAWDIPTDIHVFSEATAVVSDKGNLIWAKRDGGYFSDYSRAITALSDNSIVVTGFFEDSTTFGSGEPNETVLTSAGHWDIFIARYNPDGTLAWAKCAGGPDDDIGWGITALSDGSTVVTGSFKSTAVFGPGETNETVLESLALFSIFIAKYNPDGTLGWAKRAGGSDYGATSDGNVISTLSDNSTVLTGQFIRSATLGQGEPNQTILTSGGFFIARYNLDGTLAWAKSATANGGSGITTLSDNSTVVTGDFVGNATFGLGEKNETTLISDGFSWEIFIARYNPDGTLEWAKFAAAGDGIGGGTSSSGIISLSDDSTTMTGFYSGSATFGPGEINETVLNSAGDWDIFVARFNPDGILAWAKSAGGTGQERGSGISKLSDNSTVVTGGFYSSATFGPGETNETVLTSARREDFFIARYDPNGTLVWAKRASGLDDESGNGITSLSDNSTVVTGDFDGDATFGSGEPNETILSSYVHNDVFIARFQP